MVPFLFFNCYADLFSCLHRNSSCTENFITERKNQLLNQVNPFHYSPRNIFDTLTNFLVHTRLHEYTEKYTHAHAPKV